MTNPNGKDGMRHKRPAAKQLAAEWRIHRAKQLHLPGGKGYEKTAANPFFRCLGPVPARNRHFETKDTPVSYAKLLQATLTISMVLGFYIFYCNRIKQERIDAFI
ncbi:MAG: hypothetical protein ACLGQH_14585 [Acidobacteriota bacterium]